MTARSNDAAEKDAKDPATTGGPFSGNQLSLVGQITLVIAVVFLGSGNLVARQIAAKTLNRFDYMLGLASSITYIVVYWAILAGFHFSGVVKDVRGQMNWVWCKRSKPIKWLWAGPVFLLFALAALGDSVGDVLGFLCTPYVAGPVHALLAQCTTVFTALLSLCLLGRRYSFVQCASLVTVIAATAMGVIPSLIGDDAHNGSNPFFSFVIAFSCVFNAFAFVTKELVFSSYKTWAQEQDTAPVNASLNIFVANTAESTMQLPITLILLPLAQVMGQTHGDPLGSFLSEATSCALGNAEATNYTLLTNKESGELCKYAPPTIVVYVVFNILWNISILLSVKWSGALATFVALKAIMPTAAILFAYVDWPLLGTTELKPLTWVSLSIVVPCIAVFTYASRQQEKRAEKGVAACCWPLCKMDNEDSTEEGEGGETSLLHSTEEESAKE